MHSRDWLKRQNLRPDWFVLRENSIEVDVKRGKNKTAVKRGKNKMTAVKCERSGVTGGRRWKNYVKVNDKDFFFGFACLPKILYASGLIRAFLDHFQL